MITITIKIDRANDKAVCLIDGRATQPVFKQEAEIATILKDAIESAPAKRAAAVDGTLLMETRDSAIAPR